MIIDGLVKICCDNIVYDSFTITHSQEEHHTIFPNGDKIVTTMNYIKGEK